jgi:hypothetical protein
MILAMLLSAACTFVGPPEFEAGGEKWCEVGAFEQVELSVNDEWTKCRIDLTLNDTGMEDFTANPPKFSLFFATIIGNYARLGVDTRVFYHYDDEVIANCWADFENKQTVCEEGDGD